MGGGGGGGACVVHWYVIQPEIQEISKLNQIRIFLLH